MVWKPNSCAFDEIKDLVEIVWHCVMLFSSSSLMDELRSQLKREPAARVLHEAQDHEEEQPH